MAETIISPLLRVVSDRLESPLTSPDMDKLFKKLHMTISLTLTLVTQFESHQTQNPNVALSLWLSQIQDAAYNLDGFLDDLFNLSFKSNKVCCFFSLSSSQQSKLRNKLRESEAWFDELVQRGQKLLSVVAVAPVIKQSRFRESSSMVADSLVFGRDLDRENVVNLLLSDLSDQISFIQIVGMGGIGKTTLAQLVYNDEKVKFHFEFWVWLWVGEEFDLIGLGNGILRRLNPNWVDVSNMDSLSAAITRALQFRRSFIVLDDVWTEDDDKWSSMKGLLGSVSAGSKVLVTTRSERVAALVRSVPPYKVGLLSEYDSQLLLWNSVRDIGLSKLEKNIAKICGGLPLALMVFVRLYRLHGSQLLSVTENDILRKILYPVLESLRLSYDHLPLDLKQCFAYFSILPKGHRIKKENLIQMWIAEGFIRSTGEDNRLEEIGNQKFMELLQRSFFIVITKSDGDEIVSCQMHDFIHELAQSVSSIGCSILGSRAKENVSKQVRHVSLVWDSVNTVIPEMKNLRTLLLFSGKFEWIAGPLQKLNYLRVLDLGRSGINSFPDSIINLRHLRYLNLSHTYVDRISESIFKMNSLQALDLYSCHKLQELPQAISELSNLRHLNVGFCSSLSQMPTGIHKLKFLRSLPAFLLGRNDECGNLNELNGLDLVGKLEIKNLEYVKKLEEVHEAKLYEKLNLHSLSLSWGREVDTGPPSTLTEVLESLKPPQNLKVLEITAFRGSIFPSWMKNSALLNLVKVSLTHCSCRELPPLGQLPYLKALHVRGMFGVQVIGYEFYGEGPVQGFPSLQQLEFYDMPNLLEWKSFKVEENVSLIDIEESSGSKQAFPCLEMLSVKGFSMLSELPFFPNLKSLAICNSNNMLFYSLVNLTSLTSLILNEFEEPNILPNDLGNLPSIGKLTIYDCDDLISLLEEGVRGFPALEQLSILHCDKLTSLPTGLTYLTSLHKLIILECQNLAHIPESINYVSSLKELVIEGCPKLSSLPESMYDLTGLKSLVIGGCPMLEKQLDMEISKGST